MSKLRILYREPLWYDQEVDTGFAVDITVSGDWIRKMYWPYWWRQMAKMNKVHLATFNNCINDFITNHWGVEFHANN